MLLLLLVFVNLVYGQLQLRWYLPLGSNHNLTYGGVEQDKLFMRTENSIFAISISNGAFLWNTTVKSTFKALKMVESEIATLSDIGEFGTWNFDGIGKRWETIDLNTESSSYAILPINTEDYVIASQNNIIYHGLDRKWQYLSQIPVYGLAFVNENLVLLGREDDYVSVQSLEISTGELNIKKSLEYSAGAGEFKIISESAIWIDDSGILRGFDLAEMKPINFNFGENVKSIMLLDAQNDAESIFVVELEKEYSYRLINIQDPEAIEIFDVSNGYKSIFLMRDRKGMPIIGRVYNDGQNLMFNLLDSDNGSILQTFYVDTMFEVNIDMGYLYTWMISKEYFGWLIIGIDRSKSAFVSFRREEYMDLEDFKDYNQAVDEANSNSDNPNSGTESNLDHDDEL